MSKTLDLVGNALCLNFANTVNVRPDPSRDDLATGGDAWQWATAVRLAPDGHRPACPVHTGDLLSLRALRAAIWTVFDAVVDGGGPPHRSLTVLLGAQASALPAAVWRIEDGAARPCWATPARLGDVAGPIADSAVCLLREGPLERVGRCPGCRWLFLDTSRNGGRRWCSMSTCGSREKTARYSATRRGPSGRASPRSGR